MSPAVFRQGGFRFSFFSREEERLDVRVHHVTGEARFWLEPTIALAQNFGLSQRDIAAARRLLREHEDEIRAAWKKHFPR